MFRYMYTKPLKPIQATEWHWSRPNKDNTTNFQETIDIRYCHVNHLTSYLTLADLEEWGGGVGVAPPPFKFQK